MKDYDVIVVGAGHAGVEAAFAAARLGQKVGLITLYLDTISMMSCNPSIGGPGKSNLVTEIDILGGEMGKHTDEYNLQLKDLNVSKGPAARITRGQADKYLYRRKMREKLEQNENISLIQDCVEEILVEDFNGISSYNKKVIGVKTRLGIIYNTKTVVLATGTFLKGKIVIGDITYSAGRQGEGSAEKLSDNLRELGITNIIDTNILLDYPQIIEDKENKLIILTSVLRELDGLKKHLNQDTACNARRAAIYISRHIDRLNWYNCDKLDKEKIPVDEQLIVAAKDVDGIVITNDVYLKVRCIIANVRTKGYSLKDDYTGVYYWTIDSINNENDQKALENLLENKILPENIILNENQYFIVQDINGTDIGTFVYKNGLAIPTQGKRIKNKWIDCIFPKNPEQECLFDALSNRNNSIVYAGGKYGTGY